MAGIDHDCRPLQAGRQPGQGRDRALPPGAQAPETRACGASPAERRQIEHEPVPPALRGGPDAGRRDSHRRVQVQHHPVDAEDHRVLGEGIAPGIQLGMAHLGVDHVHHAHATRVVLEGGDPAAVGRPAQDRPGAPHPARVVGRVAEVLLAVEGQLRLLPGICLAHPEVVVADERLAPLIRRDDAGGAAECRLEAH